MPQPEGNLQPGVEENIPGVISATNTITRHGGMMHPAKRDRRKIVVDMREFGSPLPCVLHQQTMDIVPRTLEVVSCQVLCERIICRFHIMSSASPGSPSHGGLPAALLHAEASAETRSSDHDIVC